MHTIGVRGKLMCGICPSSCTKILHGYGFPNKMVKHGSDDPINVGACVSKCVNFSMITLQSLTSLSQIYGIEPRENLIWTCFHLLISIGGDAQAIKCIQYSPQSKFS